MKLQRLIESKILVVEDMENILSANVNFIEEIKENRRVREGIAHFVIDGATSSEEAIRKLALSVDTPYDLVLLDLHLPSITGGQPESYTSQEKGKFGGYKILDYIEETGSAEAVIVVSAFANEDTFLRVLRGGAHDFVIKPFYGEELQERVLACWSRLLLKKSQHILSQRIGDLIPYVEEGLARPFTNCFAKLLQTFTKSAEDMEGYVHDYYGLDRQKDSQDFLLKCLKLQESSIANAQKEWAALQTDIFPQNVSSRAEKVESLIHEIHQGLRPCLLIKNVSLECVGEENLEILTFDDDVRAVLKEILAGAVSTLPDYNRTSQLIEVKIESASGQARVSFIDPLTPISSEDAIKINEGSNISSSRLFAREWGLSVIQQIAMRGGGRLEIEPQSQGNIVTYFIPSAY